MDPPPKTTEHGVRDRLRVLVCVRLWLITQNIRPLLRNVALARSGEILQDDGVWETEGETYLESETTTRDLLR